MGIQAVLVPMALAGGLAFAAGMLVLIIAWRATGRGRRGQPDNPAACFSCGGPPLGTCELCDARFCDGHGGRRLCWGGGENGEYSIGRRLVCDRCTPSPLQLRVSFALLAVFVGAGLFFLGYGLMALPR